MAAFPLRRRAAEEETAEAAASTGGELDQLLSRPLKGLGLLAVFISGIDVGQSPVIAALGVDLAGTKHSLGVWEGSTSDRAASRAVVANLVERGLERGVRRLFVTDGGTAIGTALSAVFGRGSPIQHCRVCQRRRILRHLPDSDYSRVAGTLDEAWLDADAQRAMARLRALAVDLRAADLGATRSVLARLEETLTVARLGLPPLLRRTFSSTVEVESALSPASSDSGPLTADTSALERAAATLLKAEAHFGPVGGYRDLHRLAHALDRGGEPLPTEPSVRKGDRATLTDRPAHANLRFLNTVVDIAALVTTIALLVTLAFSTHGVIRELLALTFVTVVPGWAIIGLLELEGDIQRVALAIPVSTALCAAGAATMLWLHAWRPQLLLAVLALGSIVLIRWRLTEDLQYRLSKKPLTAALSAVAAPLAQVARRAKAAGTSLRSLGFVVRLVLAMAVQLCCLTMGILLVVRFAAHPLADATALLVGTLAGVVLGTLRRLVVIASVLLIGFLAALCAIVWQLLDVRVSFVSPAQFQAGAELGGPGMLGLALGAIVVPITRHLRRHLAARRAWLLQADVAEPQSGAAEDKTAGRLPSPVLALVGYQPGAVMAAATRWQQGLALSDFLVPIALVLWAIAIRGVRLELMNDYGLLPALPYTFFLSLVLLTVSFAVALIRSPSALRLGVHLGALVLMLHGVEPLVFARPEYVWVYKHIGVVSYLSQHGSANESLDIYQNWPGFFAAAAWFNAVAGVDSSMQYAAWAPVYINLLSVLMLGLALPALTSSGTLRWLTLFIFVAGNWVGQDYFAPQAFAFVLALGLTAVLLVWLRPQRPAAWTAALQRRLHRLLARGAGYVDASVTALRAQGRSRTALLVAVNLIFAVVVISHQLSPYMVLVGVAGLTAVDVVRPRWLLIGFTAMAIGYLMTRLTFLTHNYGDLFVAFNPFQNAHNQSVGWNQGLQGRLFGAYAARSLSLGIWGLAVVGAVRRLWHGAPTIVPSVLAVAPAALVLVQDYGGEAIYRVVLFSLPWAAFLAAAAVAPDPPWSIWDSLRVGAVLVGVVALFLPSYFGLDEINEVRPTEIAASVYYYDHGVRDSVLVLAAPSFPTRASGSYNRGRLIQGADPSLTNLRAFQGRMLTSADLPKIEALVMKVAGSSGTGYLVISAGMKVYCHVYSVLPDGSLDSLDQALATSSNWRVFYRNPDAAIYELVTSPRVGGATHSGP